jgi:tetratricopeptide (TPR) repeat protein
MSAWPSPRIAVFVSSTIDECGEERAAAREAIEAIKCDPILFESIGARPHPARVTYMEGLARAQICVIIWKESYGWIDPAINISGIEDEFRIARERNLELLVYIKADAPNRDSRLKTLLDEARTSVTTHSFKEPSELQDQISADVTSLLSRAFIERTTKGSERLLDPLAILTGSMPLGMAALNRPILERRLDEAVQNNAQTWLTGAAGAGKTILLSQWAVRRGTSYVNARGLSLRHLLNALTATLSCAPSLPESLSLEDARDRLRVAWTKNARWPLVIDDPSDITELLQLLDELGDAEGSARLIIGARDAGELEAAYLVNVPGLTSTEAAAVISSLPNAIRNDVSIDRAISDGVLPLDIRRQAAARSAPQYVVFDDVKNVAPDPKARELLAFIVASPEPLTLEELTELTSSEENVVQLDSYLATLSFLLVDDGLGFRPVHDVIAKDLNESLARRPALRRLVSLRLAQFFAKSKRFLPAFELYQEFDAARALRMAYRAAAQASMEGRFAVALRPMEFITGAKRRNDERLDLATSLVALAQAYDIVGRKLDSDSAIDEAEKLANGLDDADLKQVVADQKLIKRVRRELRPEDLSALGELRARYKAQGRASDSARLAIEEGAILISVGQEARAIPVLREAREDFQKLKDRYGVYIATRNLVVSLNMQDDGQKEAEELLRSSEIEYLAADGSLRERAWMCNILARRYRLDGRLNDAIEIAREAIEIGGKIGDPYVVALNRIALGNALREQGELDAALEEFQRSGKEAQAITRTEIDGLASRLVSSVLLEKAEDAAPYLRPQLYNQAEAFATYVIGLLSGSIAEMQVAQAYDCRGDARWGLGQKAEARLDWASAARMLLELDPDDALNEVNMLSRNLDLERYPIESMRVMLSTLPGVSILDRDEPWLLLINLIGEGVMKGHPHSAGVYTMIALKVLQGRVTEEHEVGLWLRLLTLALEQRTPPDDGRMSFVLSAFLAHTRKRSLSLTQLTALMELTLGKSEAVHFHSVEDYLQTSFKLGPEDKMLVVLNDIDSSPATRFASAALTSFFTGFRKEIDREFLSAPLEHALYIRCSVVDVSQAPADIQTILSASNDTAVSVAVTNRKAGEPHDIFIVCKPDLQERCQGDMLHGTELQILYGEVLRALLAVVLGGDIESEVLRPKIVRIVRMTI